MSKRKEALSRVRADIERYRGRLEHHHDSQFMAQLETALQIAEQTLERYTRPTVIPVSGRMTERTVELMREAIENAEAQAVFLLEHDRP